MGLKSETKKVGEGKGLLGIALAVGIGFGIVAPLMVWLYSTIKAKVMPSSTTTTPAGS